MIAVSDTTPLNYLILIGASDILPQLFGQVYVPTAVIDEMKHPRAPEIVRRWAQNPPEWVMVQAPQVIDLTLLPRLHRGEAEALSLAQELRAEWVIMDDWDGRQTAKALKIPLSGTPDVLEEAAVRGLLDIDEAVGKLKQTNYRATAEQYQATLENVRVRKLTQQHNRTLQGPDEPSPSSASTDELATDELAT